LWIRKPKICVTLSGVRRSNPMSQERSKSLWMGKFSPEDQISRIFNLLNRVVAS
jgi:hypothetical protein